MLYSHNGGNTSDGEDVPLFEGVGLNEREWVGVGEDDVADCEGGPVGTGFAAYGDNVNG